MACFKLPAEKRLQDFEGKQLPMASGDNMESLTHAEQENQAEAKIFRFFYRR